MPQAVHLPTLANRQAKSKEFTLPEDGFYQVVPLATAPNRHPVTKAPLLQVLDSAALDAILANLRQGPAELLADADHESAAGGSTRAQGWVQAHEAERRVDGLYAPIRWTNSGEAAVKGGEFRYLSPVFSFPSALALEAGRYRPTELLEVGLTNKPNFRDMVALTNREPETDTQPNDTAMALTPEQEALLRKGSQYDALLNRAEKAESELVDALLATHAVPEAAKPGLRALLLSNRAEGEKTLKALADALAAAKTSQGTPPAQPLYNRTQAGTPNASFTHAGGITPAQTALINSRTATLQAGGKSFSEAWNLANAEFEQGALVA